MDILLFLPHWYLLIHLLLTTPNFPWEANPPLLSGLVVQLSLTPCFRGGQETQSQPIRAPHPPGHMIIGLRMVTWPKPSQWESVQQLQLKLLGKTLSLSTEAA